VLQAFVWTLWLAVITMLLVTTAAIVIGSLAAFRPGGIFDRIVTFTSVIGASAPDFWIAIVGITVFAIGLGWLPTSGTGTVWH
jgi:peptide/nickel transport system permease protein